MIKVKQFILEDFFATYEFRKDLKNLASSDAVPWVWLELLDRTPALRQAMDGLTLAYPNIEGDVLPAVRDFCRSNSKSGAVATNGAAEGILLVLQACHAKYGNRLRIAYPRPSYGAVEGIARAMEVRIEPYYYRPEDHWQLDYDALLALAKVVDVVFVNTPHNPTGSVVSLDSLAELGVALATHDGLLVVDEVFRFPNDAAPDSTSIPNLVRIGSLSKVYGLPGLRFGWVLAPEDLIPLIRTWQQYGSLSINVFAAVLGSLVLRAPESFSRQSIVAHNREILTGWARQHSHQVDLIPPIAGTTAILQIHEPATEQVLFCNFLKHQVLLVPGNECFGTDATPWFRIGYGCETSMLQTGLERISEAITMSPRYQPDPKSCRFGEWRRSQP